MRCTQTEKAIPCDCPQVYAARKEWLSIHNEFLNDPLTWSCYKAKAALILST